MRKMCLIDGKRIRDGQIEQIIDMPSLREVPTAFDLSACKAIGHQLRGRLSNGEWVDTYIRQDWQPSRRPSGRVLLLLSSEMQEAK